MSGLAGVAGNGTFINPNTRTQMLSALMAGPHFNQLVLRLILTHPYKYFMYSPRRCSSAFRHNLDWAFIREQTKGTTGLNAKSAGRVIE